MQKILPKDKNLTAWQKYNAAEKALKKEELLNTWEINFENNLQLLKFDDARKILESVQEFLPKGRVTLAWKKYNNAKKNHDSKENKSENKEEKKEKDPYSVLNVSPKSTEGEVKKAYKELAKKYHPDKVIHLGDEFKNLAHEKMIKINEAYETILKDFAMMTESETKGGIDFDPANLDLQTHGDGVVFDSSNILAPCLEDEDPECSEMELKNLNITGFVPNILQIVPVNMIQLLGITNEENPFDSAQDKNKVEDLTFSNKYRNKYLFNCLKQPQTEISQFT